MDSWSIRFVLVKVSPVAELNLLVCSWASLRMGLRKLCSLDIFLTVFLMRNLIFALRLIFESGLLGAEEASSLISSKTDLPWISAGSLLFRGAKC